MSHGIVSSIHLGKVRVAWLLTTMEDVIQEEGTKDFKRTSRVGVIAILAQWCALISKGIIRL